METQGMPGEESPESPRKDPPLTTALEEDAPAIAQPIDPATKQPVKRMTLRDKLRGTNEAVRRRAQDDTLLDHDDYIEKIFARLDAIESHPNMTSGSETVAAPKGPDDGEDDPEDDPPVDP